MEQILFWIFDAVTQSMPTVLLTLIYPYLFSFSSMFPSLYKAHVSWQQKRVCGVSRGPLFTVLTAVRSSEATRNDQMESITEMDL